jgi:hypothetical protein
VAIKAIEGTAALIGEINITLQAARLWGAAEAIREEHGQPTSAPSRERMERGTTQARARLPHAAFDAAWRAGRALPLTAALDEAEVVLESMSSVVLRAAEKPG